MDKRDDEREERTEESTEARVEGRKGTKEEVNVAKEAISNLRSR